MSWTFKGYKKSYDYLNREKEIKSVQLDNRLLEQDIRLMFLEVRHG